MDGTILNKKYNLVERIEALEEGGGEEVVYLPGEAISIQELEEGERTVSVKYSDGLALNANGQLYVDFTDYDPLLYSFGNMTQIGLAVYSGASHPVYRRVIDLSASPIALTHDTWVSTGVTLENVDKLLGATVVAVGSDLDCVLSHCEVGIIDNTVKICLVTSVGNRSAKYVILDYTITPAQTAKKKSSK